MALVWKVLLMLIFCKFASLVLANDIGLDPAILYEGGEGTFVCSSQEASTNVQWIVNGSSLEDLNLHDETMLDTFSTGGALKFLNVPLDYSGTTVQCVITYTDGSMGSSNTASLLVQGLLDAVSDVSVEFASPFFIISWVSPFSLFPPRSPAITYCVSITNASTGSSLGNECGIIATNYSLNLEFNACVGYSATITPSNTLGNGASATRAFPAPDPVVPDNVARVVEPGGVILYEILLGKGVCTCEVALAGTTVNCMTNDSSISFRLGDAFSNQFLISIVTLHIARLNTASVLNISTYDVSTVSAVSASPNTVNLSASYARHSPALGVVVILLWSDTVGDVDYARSVHLVLDRAMSNGFRQESISQGNYTVLAFDVEEDGGIELGLGSPAAVERVSVQGQDLPAPFPYPCVMGVQGCFADLDDSNLLMVSCSFDTSVIMGYLAIVQFSGSYEVRTKASRDISTPVEFEGLDDGSYSVTVFPLTENGILGTYVVHSELITVTSPTTPTGQAVITMTSPTTEQTTLDLTTDLTLSSSGPFTLIISVSVVSVVLVGAVIVLFLVAWCLVKHSAARRGKATIPPLNPVYDEVEPVYAEVDPVDHGKGNTGIEMETNTSYGKHAKGKIEMETNAAYGHIMPA